MGIILNHINYIFNKGTAHEVKALDDVSLEIKDGEFLGIIGHTGSGKSTLLQHMNGLLKADSGQLFFNGEDVYDKSFNMKLLRQKVGIVFQYPEHQLFGMTVLEDVSFGPKNLGLSKLEYEKRAYDALMAVGVPDESWDASPFNLSGGQKRLVAIAGILAMEPQILVLDEPAASLDPKGRRDLLCLIKKLQQERGMTIVLVSHSMEDVADFADRIVVVDKGKIVMNNTPSKVFSNREKLEKFGLFVPEAMEIMLSLKNAGLFVDASAITLDEAEREILKLFKMG